MEGTQPDTPSPPSLRARMARKTWMLLALAVAVVVVAAVLSVYLLTPPPPILLSVSDGSTTGVVAWNETTGSNQTDLVLNFAATSYANETDGAVSTLTLRLRTWTFYASAGATLSLNINATVSGAFAPNLHPADLELEANLTGANSSLQSWGSSQFGTNVSFPTQSFGFASGSGVLSATISSGHFGYSDYFEVNGRPGHDRFVGFRATVEGPFTPPVSVMILLSVIYAA